MPTRVVIKRTIKRKDGNAKATVSRKASIVYNGTKVHTSNEKRIVPKASEVANVRFSKTSK